MVRLKVREVARAHGWTLGHLQREAKLSASTARRYWYNSTTGLERDAGTLREIKLPVLALIATLLNVRPGELLGDD